MNVATFIVLVLIALSHGREFRASGKIDIVKAYRFALVSRTLITLAALAGMVVLAVMG